MPPGMAFKVPYQSLLQIPGWIRAGWEGGRVGVWGWVESPAFMSSWPRKRGEREKHFGVPRRQALSSQPLCLCSGCAFVWKTSPIYSLENPCLSFKAHLKRLLFFVGFSLPSADFLFLYCEPPLGTPVLGLFLVYGSYLPICQWVQIWSWAWAQESHSFFICRSPVMWPSAWNMAGAS